MPGAYFGSEKPVVLRWRASAAPVDFRRRTLPSGFEQHTAETVKHKLFIT